MTKEKAVETTENYHRIPVARKKKNAKIRTITVTKGIKALYDVTNKKIVTYLFDVDKYSMKEAKKWVKDHKDSAEYNLVVSNLSLKESIDEFYKETRKETLAALAKKDS